MEIWGKPKETMATQAKRKAAKELAVLQRRHARKQITAFKNMLPVEPMAPEDFVRLEGVCTYLRKPVCDKIRGKYAAL